MQTRSMVRLAFSIIVLVTLAASTVGLHPSLGVAAMRTTPLPNGVVPVANTPQPPPTALSPAPAGTWNDQIIVDAAQTEETPLPLYVTVYYHVEPNRQLFETIEPGYFEAVSLSLRGMSRSLASIHVPATFCFAWLYNDLVYCRNHDAQTGEIMNRSLDTGIETFEQIVADGHELAYHSHPPMAVIEGGSVYYARPVSTTCDRFDVSDLHRWSGLNADMNMDFFPGVYEFDDPADPWYGQFTWERTSESLFRIANYLGVQVRHTNGGQRPLLDITNKYGSGINHEHNIRQIRSLMQRGFDLIAPEVMTFFNPDYSPEGTLWSDLSTGYVAYFGPEANVQLYYPDIDGEYLERAVTIGQGLTFMPVQMPGQTAWTGSPDTTIANPDYYDARTLGGTGGGGVQWTESTFYSSYTAQDRNPWSDHIGTKEFPSLAEQFNHAMQRHLNETPASVNAGVQPSRGQCHVGKPQRTER